MPKPKTKAKREAVKAWGWTYMGVLQGEAREDHENRWRDEEETVLVVVIREADYQRLLKAAITKRAKP